MVRIHPATGAVIDNESDDIHKAVFGDVTYGVAGGVKSFVGSMEPC